jgi:8-oxo-dGTP pyrophosphatase MutT (NUDIX family)
MERHFTVSGFVVQGRRTLLHWHRKNGMWLPPGGHIDPGEDPVQAVVREVLEETGIHAEVVPSARAYGYAAPPQIAAPMTIQVEDIAEGPHQHIDMIYALRPLAGVETLQVHDGFFWVDERQLARDGALNIAGWGAEAPVPEDVRVLGIAAIRLVDRFAMG